jgi:serine protease inhibitor
MKKWLLLVLCLFRPIFADTSLDGVSEFGWDFFQAAAKDQNTVFSPYSIYSCMAMTAAGAQGSTLTEMQKALHFPANLDKLAKTLVANNESLGSHLKIANSLWIAPQFDENGVVAAAATAASMSLTSALEQEFTEFNADHPFIFALVDLQTKVPLFIGELTSPP